MGENSTGSIWHERLFSAYTPPKSEVSKLVQQPAYLINAEALSSAYMQDFFRNRRAPSPLKGQDHE